MVPPHFDEGAVHFESDPIAYATALAEGKAASLVEQFPNAVILGADTIVYFEGKVFEKPRDEEEAQEMLAHLCGRWHSVFTALAVCQGERRARVCCETRVEFHSLTEGQIARYHAVFHGADKAGGYAIQEAGSLIVKQIEGCFYNVMGLPIAGLQDVLAKVGIDLWDYLKFS